MDKGATKTARCRQHLIHRQCNRWMSLDLFDEVMIKKSSNSRYPLCNIQEEITFKHVYYSLKCKCMKPTTARKTSVHESQACGGWLQPYTGAFLVKLMKSSQWQFNDTAHGNMCRKVCYKWHDCYLINIHLENIYATNNVNSFIKNMIPYWWSNNVMSSLLQQACQKHINNVRSWSYINIQNSHQ